MQLVKKLLKVLGISILGYMLFISFIGTLHLNTVIKDLSDIVESDRQDNFDNNNQSIKNDLELTTQIQDLARNTNKFKNEIEKENFIDSLKLDSEIKQIKNQIKEVDKQKIINGSVFVRGIEGLGSGTVIKKTEEAMYILTCHHVVEDVIEFNEKGYELGASIGYSKTDTLNKVAGIMAYGAEIIKYDEEKDLALLKVFFIDDELVEIKIAEEEPQKGDIVYSVGNPLGLLRTISKGILSNKIEGLYISDNTITFGNSGGGLYNNKGELIGVPSQVQIYGYTESMPVPESSLGQSRDLQTIKDFLKGVEY
jgi:S1-C subfamily serine protease